MAYTKLTEKGKDFIKSACNGDSNTLIQGKNKYVLPFCQPASTNKTWIASAYYNNSIIDTNEKLGNALIHWFDLYGEKYEMDANFMAAQAYAESGYKIWNYASTSAASGISQFIPAALYDIIILNKYSVYPKFTDDEISKITYNLQGDVNLFKTYDTADKSMLGKINREQLHQNIINNPEIMIKAQFRFMKYISSRCGGIASSTLFGYNRGYGLSTKSYSESVQKAKKYKPNYEDEGIGYVYNIFCILGRKGYFIPDKYFGYEDLGMDVYPNTNFQKYQADVDNS